MIEVGRGKNSADQTGYVTLSEYDKLKEISAEREDKLKSLYEALAEKEYELRRAKQREINYESSYRGLHKQMAGLIRASSASVGKKNTKCGHQNQMNSAQSAPTNQENSAPSQVTVRLQSRSKSEGYPDEASVLLSDQTPVADLRSKLSTDGEISVLPRSTWTQSAGSRINPLPDQKSGSGQKTVPLPLKVPEIQEGGSVSTKTIPNTSGIKPPVELQKHLFTAPEVSLVQFNRLASENIRMKQALLKLKDEKKIDVYSFMNCLEFERVNRQLQDDLKRSKSNQEELARILLMQSGKDESGLAQKLLQYQQQGDQLTKQLQKTRRELEKVQSQAAKLQDQVQKQDQLHKPQEQQLEPFTAAAVEAPHVAETQATTELQSLKSPTTINQHSDEQVITSTSPGPADVGEISQLRTNQMILEKEKANLQKRLSDLSQELSEAKVEKDALYAKCKTLTETLESKNSQQHPSDDVQPVSMKEEEQVDKMRLRLTELQEEKDVLLMQLQAFEEDYKLFQEDFQKKDKIIQEQKLKMFTLEQQSLSMAEECRRRRDLEAENRQLRTQLQSQHRGGPRSSLGYHSSSMRSPAGSIQEEGYGSLNSNTVGRTYESHIPSRFSDTSSGYGSGYSSAGSVGQQEGQVGSMTQASSAGFTCDRCLEEFKIFEREKYEEHIKKCVI